MICRHIEKMTGYTPGEQPHFVDMIKLNTNENPYPPSPKVGEALAGFDWQQLRLYPDPVFQKARAVIAQNNHCSEAQVFVGNGSDEILALFTRAFVETQGTVGYFDPTYSLYPVLAAIRDAQGKPFALNTDFSCPTPPADWSDAFIWTNPNAPTSLMAPTEQVTAFCKRFHGVVLIDEAYADFAPANCMAFAASPENTNTLVMRTLSKSFALAGIRFGYLVGPASLIDTLYKIKDSYNIDTLAQIIGTAALSDLPYMQQRVATILATRTRLETELRARGWQVIDSATNFLFAKPPAPTTAAEVFAKLREHHIFVRYFPAPATRDYLRITIGTDAQVDTLLSTL